MMKILSRALAALALTAVATAASAQDEKTIGISFPHAGQPVVETIIEFAREKGATMGYEIVVDDPGDDLNRQVGTLETWIDSGAVDAIVSVVPNSPDVFNAIAKRAEEAGIPWITYAASIENQSAFLSWDHLEGGRELGNIAAKWINDHHGGNAKVALLTFERGEWSRKRREGIEAALTANAPQAEIVARQDALDPSEAAAAMDSILQANPDLQVVLAIMPAGGEGAYQAFLNAGHEPNDPDIFIGDVDGSARSLTLIRDGSMYRAAAALDLQAIGDAIPELVDKLLAGEQTEGIMIPYVMITADNADEAQRFIDQWN